MFPPRIQLGILDAHPLVIKGLKAMFENCADFEVVGAFGDSTELLSLLPTLQADVLMIEYFLDGCGKDCADLITNLLQRQPGLKIMILSASLDPAIVALALRLGAHGYLCKSAQERTIIDALRRVHGGGRYVDPAVRHRLPDSVFPVSNATPDRRQDGQRGHSLLDSAKLSPNERLVLKKFVAGANIREIATGLKKSPKTVSTQKAAAFRKLGVFSDSGLYRLITSTAEPH